MTDAPEWFEDDLDTRRGTGRRWLKIAAVVAGTWIAVAVVIVGRDGASSEPPAPPAPPTAAGDAALDTPTDGDRTPDAAADPAPGHARANSEDLAGTSDPAAPVPALGDETITRQQLDALALVIVRSWLSDGGPDLEVPGVGTDRHAYLEHAAVESVEVAGDLAVARTVLLLLVRDGDHYTEAVVRRAAVPFVATPTSLRPAGTPWWLPDTSSLRAAPPDVVPDDDPATAAAVEHALTAAGYLDVAVSTVAVTDTGTVVAELTARTATDEIVDGPVWLHPTRTGLIVLGADHRHPPAGEDAAAHERGSDGGNDTDHDTTDETDRSGDAPD